MHMLASKHDMKHLLLTTIAAVVLVGSAKPPPPDISIHEAAKKGNIEAFKQHLAAGTDVNAKDDDGETPLVFPSRSNELKPQTSSANASQDA